MYPLSVNQNLCNFKSTFARKKRGVKWVNFNRFDVYLPSQTLARAIHNYNNAMKDFMSSLGRLTLSDVGTVKEGDENAMNYYCNIIVNQSI